MESLSFEYTFEGGLTFAWWCRSYIENVQFFLNGFGYQSTLLWLYSLYRLKKELILKKFKQWKYFSAEIDLETVMETEHDQSI